MAFDGFDKFAKSGVFENIIKEKALSLNIAFVCFYGSRNYNLETGKSDYDFFIVYYPSFDNFYTNRFERFSVIEKEYDYFITPVHEYISHAMKGNIKFIEPIICGTVFELKGFKAVKARGSGLLEKIRKFILINYKKNFNAMLGIANNKKLNIVKGLYTSNTLKYEETHGYDIKEAINSLRILFLLENYIKSGQFSFMVKGNPVYKEFEDYMLKINEGIISKEIYLEIVGKKASDVLKLKNNLDILYEEQKQVIIKKEEEIKDCVKKLCRDNICFAKQI
ncbi:MAG: hypothetical protein M0016_03610 [Deltaproteobacteria bacterium]|jgi:hypothetical protein|nr:hypothetical protein [Deltaproteobacteria bacterium]MCL5880767.1 hypothetical protein [Deltaproteobacteria bacterium]MDA8304233.1 hypothetical protein [Deltaproteobacteria bacterium]